SAEVVLVDDNPGIEVGHPFDFIAGFVCQRISPQQHHYWRSVHPTNTADKYPAKQRLLVSIQHHRWLDSVAVTAGRTTQPGIEDVLQQIHIHWAVVVKHPLRVALLHQLNEGVALPSLMSHVGYLVLIQPSPQR